jgi:hypothetical protein
MVPLTEEPPRGFTDDRPGRLSSPTASAVCYLALRQTGPSMAQRRPSQ